MKAELCNRDCFNCPYDDCINDEFDYTDYLESQKLDRIVMGRKDNEPKRDAEYKHMYYLHHREKLLRYQREYYRTHKGEKLAYMHMYGRHNKDQISRQKREYYQANKDRILARQREYRQAKRQQLAVQNSF